eukprot:CAMPEP_0178451182 /NCGR_PEP_ID=MMETSP0689_2-20121128/43537_1 /TAXON_ID=160604 /ORGANISM="Amphidinium massartii, Strain CS-259" /LENGTH=664 /DNA_ID=CAMNT_0020076729 /DNA_START=30 /DNA_END=2024 /DNA_ORIENTATION=+
MSGGFRDSFTKEDTKEDLLGYDDTAFYYFAITCLTCVALPWTISLLSSLGIFGKSQFDRDFPRKNHRGHTLHYCQTQAMVEKLENTKREYRKSPSGSMLALKVVKMVVLLTMWIAIFGTIRQLGQETEINKFDPFDILDVKKDAGFQDIRRAYRKLSLSYHPDKNPDDPLAASRFIQITKAYQALTDDVARRNWEKYGNPDGPQTTKVGIGLPRFLLQKENNLMILCSFFFVIIFLVPMTFICYYNHTKNFASNGVLLETLQFLGYYVTENTRVKACPELLAACAEGRCAKPRPTDAVHADKLAAHVMQHKKGLFTLPMVIKNQLLIWGHMQRKHSVMSEELRTDSDMLLRHSMKITQAMIEIACMREWFGTAQAVIEFRRCLVQALDIKSSPLLQVPHITEGIVEILKQQRPPVVTLVDFLSLETDQRRRSLCGLTPDQMADVDAFCSHVGIVNLTGKVEVEDEGEMVVGDVATVTAKLERTQLQEGEAIGPVHAPYFPRLKFAEWWLFLVEAGPTPRILHFERVRDTARLMEEKLRFQVTKAGANNLVLHALCDAYAGLDQKVDLSFNALAEDELKRTFPVHKEDEELDLQPTFVQQWMGDFRRDDESEEEEDEGKASHDASDKKAGGVAKEDRRNGESPKKEDPESDDESSDSSSESGGEA